MREQEEGGRQCRFLFSVLQSLFTEVSFSPLHACVCSSYPRAGLHEGGAVQSRRVSGRGCTHVLPARQLGGHWEVFPRDEYIYFLCLWWEGKEVGENLYLFVAGAYKNFGRLQNRDYVFRVTEQKKKRSA